MNNVSEEMKHLHKLAKCAPGKRFDHLWEKMTSSEWLMQAWEEIRSNKGSMTAGIDSTIAVDIDPERIQRLSERLKASQYRPKPVRRVYIAKGNGKMRPLGIPLCRAYGTSWQGTWESGAGEGSSSALPSLPQGSHRDACRDHRRRTGLRNATMSSGVRGIQRGWCGASWRYSSRPAWHQSAIVPTSTLSRWAAARAEYRPAPRGRAE